MALNGNAWANAKSAFIVEASGKVTVGDGTSTSTAHIMTNNSLQVLGGSQLGIANGNNYLYTTASSYTDGTNSYAISSNSISCGSGHSNACTAGYVYGCATLNNSGAVGCVTLALAVPDLAARISNGQVILSFQVKTGSGTDRFLIQRSADGSNWTLVGEVTVDEFTTSYSIQDPQARHGVNYYRLQLADENGRTAFSHIASVTMDTSSTMTTIFPNPIQGRNFSLKTSSTDETILKVLTVSGQPLLLRSLKGQTIYSVQLPVSLATNSCLLVQVIGNGRTQTFTVLAQ
jgi:hypothetical protein